MAYQLPVELNLGQSQSGLSLVPTLLDGTGATTAGLTTVSSYEIGPGRYFFLHSVPDGHIGTIKYLSAGVFKEAVLVAPRESEFADVKTSTRADGSAYTNTRAAKLDFLDATISGIPALVWSYTSRTLTSIAQAVDISANAIAAIWNALVSSFTTNGSIGALLRTDVDAAVSTRLPTSSYVTPPTAQQNSTAAWSEPLPAAFAAGTAGYLLSRAGTAGDPWTTPLPGSYAAGTAGFILGTRLDAPITSRADSQYWTSARATKVDFLDASVSSRADAAYYSPARALLLDNLTRLDVLLSSRSTLTALQVDTQLSGTHGPGDWQKGSLAGTGSNTVTITLKDDTGANVIGLAVTVKSSDQTGTVGQQMTDANGRAGFNLDAGTYAVLVASDPRFQTLGAQTLNVSGTTTVQYVLTRIALLAPTDGSGQTAVIYADVVRITGQPAVGVPITFSLPWIHPGEEQPAPGSFITTRRTESVQTDNAGRFSVTLIRSSALLAYLPPDLAKYRVECPLCNLDAVFAVPDVQSLNLSSLWPPFP